MIRRLTKRYIVNNLDGLNLSSPLRYERYYINNNLRVQKKNEILEKEVLNDKNEVVLKTKIEYLEFERLKAQAYKKIIRDSYLYLDDDKVSIKSYYDDYEGLNRVEVKFDSEEEMRNYQPLSWMGEDITNTSLAFDKDLSKLSKKEFLAILNNYEK